MKKLIQLSLCAGMMVMGALSLVSCDSSKQKMAHVKIQEASHTIVFEPGKRHLSKTEFDALNGFMRSVPVSAISYVGLSADDHNKQALLHARQIKAYLVKQGVDHDAIHLQPASSGNPTTLVLYLQYAVAVPPTPCPDWSKDGAGTYNSTTGSNFGCAYYNDTVLQMANPADFAGGQGQVPVIDTDRDSAAIQKYRGISGGPGSGGASGAGGGASSPGTGAR